MLVGLSLVELVVVHALLAIWRPWIAFGASVISLAGIGWLIGAIRSFRHRPVLVGPDRLLMQVGYFRRLEVPVAAVRGLRPTWTADTLKRRDVLNLALIAYPNVMLDLHEPQRVGRRFIVAVAHRLDDPVGFAAAVKALEQGDD